MEIPPTRLNVWSTLWHVPQTELYVLKSLSIFSCIRYITHWDRVTHICVNKLTIIGSDNGLSQSAPSHYLNQWWDIVNWNLRNKFQWNLERNSYIFIQENAFENVVCKMAVILSRPQCDKHLKLFLTSYMKDSRNRILSLKICRYRLQSTLLLTVYGSSMPLSDGSSQWRHNERDSVSNHRHLDGLLIRLFRRRSKETSKVHATGLWEVTGGFPSQRVSNDDVIMLKAV